MKPISSSGGWGGGGGRGGRRGGKTLSLKAEDMKLREYLLEGFIVCMKVLLSAKSERKGSQGEGLRKEMIETNCCRQRAWQEKYRNHVSQQKRG